jgi:hypothetical protein
MKQFQMPKLMRLAPIRFIFCHFAESTDVLLLIFFVFRGFAKTHWVNNYFVCTFWQIWNRVFQNKYNSTSNCKIDADICYCYRRKSLIFIHYNQYWKTINWKDIQNSFITEQLINIVSDNQQLLCLELSTQKEWIFIN